MKIIDHNNILSTGKYKKLSLKGVNKKLAKQLYVFMLRLRVCEEALSEEYHPADEMRCPVHFCIGQEAVPAALALVVNEKDYLLPVNNYAWSKLGGECAVQLYKNSLILRMCMTEKPFIHKSAFYNVKTSFMFQDEVAKIFNSIKKVKIKGTGASLKLA